MSMRDYTRDGLPSARSLRLGAAALVGVVLLGLGVVVGRATAGGGGRSPATGPAPASPSPTSAGVPSWAMGATRMDHGVPVGYAHTQAGAIAAAKNYFLALGSSPLALDPQTARSAQAFLDIPSSREKDAQRLEQTLAGAAPLIAAAHQGHATRVLPFVLTSRVDSFGSDDAQVTVWGGVVIASDGVLAPQLTLGEDTFALRWLGDWRIADDSSSDGPGVSAMVTPAQTKSLPPALRRESTGVGDVFPQ